MACASACGFQSESKRMTVSAVWRFTPRPPARVVMRKAKMGESGALYSSMLSCRRTRFVQPSRRV